MALKWIIGDFRTGAISETNELPVVDNSGDKIEIDINANESATITVSKNDLPSDWRTYLKPLDRFVALIETDLAWGSSVIWAGFINKASARVNETVQIQAAGLREYMAARIVSNTYNTTNANPEAAVVFESAHIRGMMANMILACFSSSGIPSSSPKPPQVLSSVTGSASGSTVSHSVLLSDFQNYGNMLDEWRDELSDNGQEYRFAPSWSSSSKTAIRWIGEVASTNTPHFNEENTLNIVLGDNSWKPIGYGQSASTDNMISRIIGQSKEGADNAGADYTTKTTTSSTSILLDESFNPGIELTTSQMTDNLNARLNYNSQTFKEADFSRAYETTAELRTIISQLGSMATFSGSGAAQYFGLTMRIVGITFNVSKKTVEIQLAPKAARYPKLPKDNRALKPKSETKHYKPKNPNYGNYTRPISPQPKPGDNGTTDIPGGLPKPVIPPPFTPPTNDRDVYTEEESVIEMVDARWFKSDSKLSSDNGDAENWTNYWHPYPLATHSRFNDKTGELIGLSSSGQPVYRSINHDVGNTTMNYNNPPEDVHIWAVKNIEEMFDRDTNPYMNTQIVNSFNESLYADNHKYKVGTIPASAFSEILMDIDTFRATIEDSPSSSSERQFWSPIDANFDYSFFCSEDFQTVYVHIIGTVSLAYALKYPGTRTKYSHCATLSRLFKGVRNSEGVVESWENLGQGLVKNPGQDNAEVFFSNAIYEINDEFMSFGGFLLPQSEEKKDITNLFYPFTSGNVDHRTVVYCSNFYSQNVYRNLVPENPFSSSGQTINLGSIDKKYAFASSNSTAYLKNAAAFLSVDVSYDKELVFLGITQGGQESTTSMFELSFDNLTNSQKAIDTTREKSVRYSGGWDSPGRRNITGTRTEDNPEGNGSKNWRHSNQSCVKYKNNYFWISPVGYNAMRYGNGTTTDNLLLSESHMAAKLQDKKIRYFRSKEDFTDVVMNDTPYLSYTANVNTYTSSTLPIQVSLPWTRHNKQIGDVLFSYRGNEQAANNIASSNYVEKPVGGFKYFVKGDFLYLVCDSRYWSTHDYQKGGLSDLRLAYWVGKFRFKDELL